MVRESICKDCMKAHEAYMAKKLEQCNRKHKYQTAESAIRWALIRAKNSGTPLRVYECHTCNGWHLTKRKSL
jgi:hypothetical protein